MSEWKEYKLGEIIQFGNGKTRPKTVGCIPVFGGNGVLEYCGNSNYEDETIIIGRVGAYCGSVFYQNKPIWVSDNALAAKPKNGFNSKFLYYYLKNLELNNFAEGSSHPLVTQTLLNSIEISITDDIVEQTAIVSVLSSLDDKIDLLHRQNATLEKMAETLFRQWFDDKNNDDTIFQLIYIQNGYAFKSKDFKEIGDNGVIKIKNISGGIIDIEKTDFVEDEVALSIPTRFRIVTGDILIAMTGAEIGKLGIIPKTAKNIWLNQRVGLLKEKYLGSKYLAYLQLKSEFGQDYIENTATGSAQPNISGIGIENCRFPKLSIEQIEYYSVQIGELYENVIFNLGQIRTLTQLRDTLLPKLMSGEIKIKRNENS
jgi:type I restriction enzyme S subunit